MRRYHLSPQIKKELRIGLTIIFVFFYIWFYLLWYKSYFDKHMYVYPKQKISAPRFFTEKISVPEFIPDISIEEIHKHIELASTDINNFSDTSYEYDSMTYLGEFEITRYCDCPICQGEWVGTTALGVEPTVDWTIAVDPDIIPLGSTVMINGNIYRAEDTGSAIIGNHVDIFTESHEECFEKFNGYTDVYLISKGE